MTKTTTLHLDGLSHLDYGQHFYFEDCDDGVHFAPVYGVVKDFDADRAADRVELFIGDFYNPPRQFSVKISAVTPISNEAFALAESMDWPPLADVQRRMPGMVSQTTDTAPDAIGSDDLPWDEMVIARALYTAARYTDLDNRGDRNFQDVKAGEVRGFLAVLNSRYPGLAQELEADWFHREEWALTGNVNQAAEA